MLTQIRERPHDVRHLTVFAKSMIRKKPASGLDAGGRMPAFRNGHATERESGANPDSVVSQYALGVRAKSCRR
jgi:hypothetical protein